MFWYLLIGYVATSQILVVGSICVGLYFAKDCPGNERLETVDPSMKLCVSAFSILAGFLLAPITAPFMVWMWTRCFREVGEETKYWKSIQRSQFEYSFDPCHRANINDELWGYMEEQSVGPLALGYQSLGEFWLKDFEPFNSKARFLMHPDNLAIAEISETIEIQSCELMSFLDDGSVIATVSCEPFAILDQMTELGYHGCCYPNFDMDQLVQEHDLNVARISQDKNVPVRKISNNNWKEYVDYNGQRFGQIQFELGEKDAPPEQCEFPVANPDELALSCIEPATVQ